MTVRHTFCGVLLLLGALVSGLPAQAPIKADSTKTPIPDVSGRWRVLRNLSGGTMTIQLRQDGASLSGELQLDTRCTMPFGSVRWDEAMQGRIERDSVDLRGTSVRLAAGECSSQYSLDHFRGRIDSAGREILGEVRDDRNRTQRWRLVR